MAGPAPRRRPRPVRPLLRRELPRHMGHRPRGHRPLAHHGPAGRSDQRRSAPRRAADFEPGERIDPRWVAYLISSAELDGLSTPPAWLAALKPAMVGAYSADNMDYVPRDSYICGVAAGPVDVQRIIHYSFISERGLTLHAHAAEALYMFLNARLYLYSPGLLPPHRPAHRPAAARGLPSNASSCCWAATRWRGWTATRCSPNGRCSPRSTAGRSATGTRGSASWAAAWGEVVARRLKWKLIYQGHTDAKEIPSGALSVTREQFARELRERLPKRLARHRVRGRRRGPGVAGVQPDDRDRRHPHL